MTMNYSKYVVPTQYIQSYISDRNNSRQRSNRLNYQRMINNEEISFKEVMQNAEYRMFSEGVRGYGRMGCQEY